MQVQNDREINLQQLHTELQVAGVIVPALGRYGQAPYGETLHTYDEQGRFLDLPANAEAVVDAHEPEGDP